MGTPEAVAGDLFRFVCPRCGGEVDERFYGPCTPCRDDLRARLQGERQDIAVEYEPKVNVVANHVAASRNDT
jgi:hypothetical protein